MSQVNYLNFPKNINKPWEVLAKSHEVFSHFVNWICLSFLNTKKSPLVPPLPPGHTLLGGTAGIGSQPHCAGYTNPQWIGHSEKISTGNHGAYH